MFTLVTTPLVKTADADAVTAPPGLDTVTLVMDICLLWMLV